MLASLNQNRYRINRKPGQVNLYDDLVLQVETLEGEIMKGVNYTWTFPQGITGTVDPAARHKTTVNKVGNYKVNVTGSGGVSCPLEIDVSALACATPADFIACGNTGSVSSTGTEKLKNLAVGDEFTTYDYIVRVTEVSGSETSGWTGKGELVMNFLKIGSSPVVEIPLAVEFNGINLNQCYQLLAGPKVRTVLDPNWSNVVNVDVITDRLKDIYAEVKDLLVSDPNNKVALETKIAELETIKTDLASSGLRPEYITEQTTAVNVAIAAVSCYAAAPGARSANSCTADDVVTALDGAESVVLNKPCNPTERGNIYSWMLKKFDPSDYIKNFADGYVAHNIISSYYLALPGNALAKREYAIPYSSPDEKRYGYADLVNFTNGHIFEIKTFNGLANGAKEVNRYVNQANKYCPPSAGSLWSKGTNFPTVVFPWPLDPTEELYVTNEESGVITYQTRKKTVAQKTPIPEYEPLPVSTTQRLTELLKRLVKNPDSAYRDREIRKLLLDLSEGAVISIIVGGVVVDILGGLQIYASVGTAAVPATLQIAIATSFVVIGYEILSN